MLLLLRLLLLQCVAPQRQSSSWGVELSHGAVYYSCHWSLGLVSERTIDSA